MRRGQTRPPPSDPHRTFTKRDLVDAGGISAKSFDTIRKAARVKGPSHGGLGALFDVDAVRTLIRRAESGTYTERGAPAARAWRELLTERGIDPDGHD
jgi:hypothetical protein